VPGSPLDTPSPRRPGIASAASRRAGLGTVVLLAPACVLFSVFVLYPILRTVLLSL